MIFTVDYVRFRGGQEMVNIFNSKLEDIYMMQGHVAWMQYIFKKWKMFDTLSYGRQSLVDSYLSDNTIFYRRCNEDNYHKAPRVNHSVKIDVVINQLDHIFKDYKTTSYVDMYRDVYEDSWIFLWTEPEQLLLNLLSKDEQDAYISDMKERLLFQYSQTINVDIDDILKDSHH